MATIEAVFAEGRDKAFTKSVYQYDRGLVLKLVGIDLPSSYDAQFSNHENGDVALGARGTEEGVKIPDAFLQSGHYVYAWIYVGSYQNGSGSTRYMVTIPVIRRPAMISSEDVEAVTPTGYSYESDGENLVLNVDLSNVVHSMEDDGNG